MTPSGALVVLHAHPDDEAIFSGSTIRAAADSGLRVVLITATDGREGVPRVPLRRGESIRTRRLAELEEAASILGVARLHVLPYADSDAHGGPYRRGSLGAARVAQAARRVRSIAESENATAIVHYDSRGVYGHVDHVQVHRVGARVTSDLAITGYEATVDGNVVRNGPRHVLQQAAGDDLDVGLPAAEITFTVRADDHLLAAKLSAMAAHSSQIGPEHLDGTADAYRYEWFVRRGPGTVLDDVLDDVLDGARATSRCADRSGHTLVAQGPE